MIISNSIVKASRVDWQDINIGSILFDPGYGMGNAYIYIVKEKNDVELNGIILMFGEFISFGKNIYSREDFNRFNDRGEYLMDIKNSGSLLLKIIKEVFDY